MSRWHQIRNFLLYAHISWIFSQSYRASFKFMATRTKRKENVVFQVNYNESTTTTIKTYSGRRKINKEPLFIRIDLFRVMRTRRLERRGAEQFLRRFIHEPTRCLLVLIRKFHEKDGGSHIYEIPWNVYYKEPCNAARTCLSSWNCCMTRNEIDLKPDRSARLPNRNQYAQSMISFESQR